MRGYFFGHWSYGVVMVAAKKGLFWCGALTQATVAPGLDPQGENQPRKTFTECPYSVHLSTVHGLTSDLYYCEQRCNLTGQSISGTGPWIMANLVRLAIPSETLSSDTLEMGELCRGDWGSPEDFCTTTAFGS